MSFGVDVAHVTPVPPVEQPRVVTTALPGAMETTDAQSSLRVLAQAARAHDPVATETLMGRVRQLALRYRFEQRLDLRVGIKAFLNVA